MFDFLKKYFGKIESRDEINYETKEDENNLEDKEISSKEVNSLELDFEIKDFEEPKYVLKEDVEIMAQTLPFPCDYVNNIPQSILQVRKDLVTDPDAVSVYINLPHLEQFKVMEEAFNYQVEVNNPCGGTGTITGEALLKEIILISELNYSVLIYDTVTSGRVYAGEVDSKTGFFLYKIVPFEEEVIINKDNFEPQFDANITRLPDVDGLDYYMYKIDGTFKLVEKQP